MGKNPYILGIGGSPRRGGNSDRLLDKALAGAQAAGAQVEKLVLNELHIRPCQECGGCAKTGQCVIKDDMQHINEKLAMLDGLVIASPIFFSSVSAQLKTMIDRAQCRWVAKYCLGKSEVSPKRPGIFICVRGQEGLPVMECAARVVKAFFATENVRYMAQLFVEGIDTKGAIDAHPEILDQAYNLGRQLVQVVTSAAN